MRTRCWKNFDFDLNAETDWHDCNEIDFCQKGNLTDFRALGCCKIILGVHPFWTVSVRNVVIDKFVRIAEIQKYYEPIYL